MVHRSFEGLRARPDHRREDSDDLRRLAALPSPSRFAPPVSFYQALPAVRFATPVMRGGHFRNPNAAELTSMGVGVSRGSLSRVSAWMLHSSAGRALNTKRSTLVLPARHVEAERGHERLDLNGKGALCRVTECLLRRLDRGFHVDRWRVQPHSAETAADHIDGL